MDYELKTKRRCDAPVLVFPQKTMNSRMALGLK
jgi:hypothetical protein